MKIVYHHQTLMDGAEAIHILGIFQAFQRLGHQVKMVAKVTEPPVQQGNGSEAPAVNFVQKLRQILPGWLYEWIRILYNWIETWQFFRVLGDEKPDVVYKRHANFNFGPLLAARWRRIPVILEVNSIYSYPGRLKFEDVHLKRIAYWIENFIFKRAFFIVTVSTQLKQILQERSIDEKKILVLPNGVDMEKFTVIPENALANLRQKWGEHQLIIGFVGILRNWHGMDFLLETLVHPALQLLDFKLIVVGNGENRPDYEKFVWENNLQEKVVFIGRISHEKVPVFIASFDVCIMPDSNDYGSPMKIIEYMAMGKPVLAPDLLPIRDIIDDGVNGILFRQRDSNNLAAQLLKLANNEYLRQKLGQNARKKVEQQLNWLANARKILETFSQLRAKNVKLLSTEIR